VDEIARSQRKITNAEKGLLAVCADVAQDEAFPALDMAGSGDRLAHIDQALPVQQIDSFNHYENSSSRRAELLEMPQDKLSPRKALRDEFKSHLTPEEIRELDVDLPAGANHYRAFVGPPFNYDINGAMQFQFLLDLGLREYHRFLEIGCGSLRLGRLLITYLLPDRYFGVEPNEVIFRQGLVNNLGSEDGDMVRLKRPTFQHDTRFDYSFTGAPVDFIIAQSIASHTGVKETRALMQAIADASHSGTIAMMTYIRCAAETQNNTNDGWFYPDCVTYTDGFMAKMAEELGLHAYRTRWPHLNQRPDGMVTTQTPLILSKTPWRPTLPHRAYGIRFEGIVPLHVPGARP